MTVDGRGEPDEVSFDEIPVRGCIYLVSVDFCVYVRDACERKCQPQDSLRLHSRLEHV